MDNWSKIEFICAKDLNINPIILEQIEFWRIEKLILNFEEYINKQKEQQIAQEKEQSKQYAKQQTSQPKTNYGGFNVPKMQTPKMPSFK